MQFGHKPIAVLAIGQLLVILTRGIGQMFKTTLRLDDDTRDFIAACRTLTVTPHVARNLARAGGSALDARTVRHPGYEISQWIRKRVEEAFGWMKTIGGLRRTRYRGRERVQMHAYLVAAAYNLIRIAKLSPAPA